MKKIVAKKVRKPSFLGSTIVAFLLVACAVMSFQQPEALRWVLGATMSLTLWVMWTIRYCLRWVAWAAAKTVGMGE